MAPEVGESEIALVNVPPEVVETSRPAGAVTVTSPVSVDPLTVNDRSAEAVP